MGLVGLSDADVLWFTLHAELDADHGEEFRKYAGRAAESLNGLRELRTLTLEMCAATKAVWNGNAVWHEVVS